MGKNKRHNHGMAPGSLIPEPGALQPSISILAYGPDDMTEARLQSVAQIRDYLGKWPVLWVNVDGLGDAGVIAEIGKIFNLHPLALEDTINAHQRPKTDDYGDHIFTVCRIVNDAPGLTLDMEQIAMFMGRGFVVSFQERPGDCWEAVRERIRRNAIRKLRSGGADYLLYSLLDSLVDSFFPMLEKFGDHIDALEERALGRPNKAVMAEIQAGKRGLYAIRHMIWPLREALSQIVIQEDIVKAETKIFFRDCQDHIVQLLDITESYRERVSGLVDLYLSSLSNRMNEIMKVLAIITTIFMPLSFVAGVYGMNFENMPELHTRYGYFVVLGVMAVIALLMVIGFRRIGWVGRTVDKP